MSSDEKEVAAEQTSFSNSHVAVKPPVFDENSSARWFAVLESQFVLGHISSSSTKFHHVLANLPLQVANKIPDDVFTCNVYETLKNAVIGLFARSPSELFDTIMAKDNVLPTKPSIYLQEIRRIGTQLGLHDNFLKMKFLKALPDSIRPMLIIYQASSLEELARVADTLLEYSPQPSVNSSYSDLPASHPAPSNIPPIDHHAANISSHRHQPRETIPIDIRPFYADQKPQVCRAHLYFGESARSCRSWCILASSSVNVLPNSRPPSRSSSPTPQSYSRSMSPPSFTRGPRSFSPVPRSRSGNSLRNP